MPQVGRGDRDFSFALDKLTDNITKNRGTNDLFLMGDWNLSEKHTLKRQCILKKKTEDWNTMITKPKEFTNFNFCVYIFLFFKCRFFKLLVTGPLLISVHFFITDTDIMYKYVKIVIITIIIIIIIIINIIITIIKIITISANLIGPFRILFFPNCIGKLSDNLLLATCYWGS